MDGLGIVFHSTDDLFNPCASEVIKKLSPAEKMIRMSRVIQSPKEAFLLLPSVTRSDKRGTKSLGKITRQLEKTSPTSQFNINLLFFGFFFYPHPMTSIL